MITSTISRHVHQVAERLEGELSDEQSSFIEGCPDRWYQLPEPPAPLLVNLDGSYVHARSKESRKDGSFEVIVGKSTTGAGANEETSRNCSKACVRVKGWKESDVFMSYCT